MLQIIPYVLVESLVCLIKDNMRARPVSAPERAKRRCGEEIGSQDAEKAIINPRAVPARETAAAAL